MADPPHPSGAVFVVILHSGRAYRTVLALGRHDLDIPLPTALPDRIGAPMNDKENIPHILPLKTYLIVGGFLLVMTAVTVIVAQIDLGPFNLVVAMLIAMVKAALVALVFMHLWYDSKLYLTVFLVGVVFLSLFIIFSLFDTLRRDDIYSIRSRQVNEKAIIYDSPGDMTDSSSSLIDSISANKLPDSSKASVTP